MTLATATGGVLPPPTDMHADPTVGWIVLAATVVFMLVTLAYAASDLRRRRSPMLALLILSGLTICPFAVEPTYDIVMATWYPPNLPLQVATVAGRPMSLMVVLMWGSSIPLAAYIAYRLIVRGAPVARIIKLAVAISLIEGAGEMTNAHFDVMRYYGNHALIFGMPLPSLVQNAGMFAIIGVALAWLAPHLRGWRWIAVPFVIPTLYLGYVLGCTFPNFLAIHAQASPALFWALALLSSALNAGAALAALHTPTARHYRQAAAAHAGATQAAPHTPAPPTLAAEGSPA